MPASCRSSILIQLAQTIREIKGPFVTQVAIDGIDGAGKTTFADALAVELEKSRGSVIGASVLINNNDPDASRIIRAC